MASPNKDTSMLIDIKYVKANKREGLQDYLYIIWRDSITGEKYMQAVPEPKMDIYFEKNEFRNHAYNKNYERIENLEKKTVKFKDIVFAIAEDAGEEGKRLLNNAFTTGNYQLLKNLLLYPYVYGADYDCASWYRIQWLQTLDNDLPKKLRKSFLDIEVDGFEVPGMPSPKDCPVNAVTFIDEWNKTVYTFLLTHRAYTPKDMTNMSPKEIEEETRRINMYESMYEQQDAIIRNPQAFIDELHEAFDESYGELDYRLYFYEDERKMLVHIFQLINTLKVDMCGIWNIGFDMPYLMERMEVLGLDPKQVMSHPDFPNKQCYFKADTRNHDIKNKSDFMHLTSYTIFIDQMELYASIRKGGSELRSYRLNFIGEKELKDTKLDYSEDGDIKTLPYTNFKKFVMYNIKDVLLQLGIERKVTDFDTLYISSYKNATAYDKVFKQTMKLRNVQYLSFLKQGLIPGENINVYNQEVEKYADEEDDEDEAYEGALVADPTYNGPYGVKLYGRRTNNVFANGIDFDMSSFYPSSIFAMNIDPSTLIFKTIMPIDQFENYGGNLKLRGITNDYFNIGDDAAKECIDNFQTGNFTTTGTKWLNLPTVDEVYKVLKERL